MEARIQKIKDAAKKAAADRAGQSKQIDKLNASLATAQKQLDSCKLAAGSSTGTAAPPFKPRGTSTVQGTLTTNTTTIPTGTKVGRYVRVTTNTTEAVNLEAILVSMGGTPYTPTSGECNPPMDPNNPSAFPWTNLIKDDGDSFAHTAFQKGAFVQLDFGKDVPIDQIVVVNRKSCCQDRVVGATVSIIKNGGTGDKPEWSTTITTNALYYTFKPPLTTYTSGDTYTGFFWENQNPVCTPRPPRAPSQPVTPPPRRRKGGTCA